MYSVRASKLMQAQIESTYKTCAAPVCLLAADDDVRSAQKHHKQNE